MHVHWFAVFESTCSFSCFCIIESLFSHAYNSGILSFDKVLIFIMLRNNFDNLSEKYWVKAF